jgi:hypothetical protein
MANPYSEAWSRGEVAKDQQAPLYGYAAGGAAGIAAAHYVGKVEIPKDLNAFKTASDAAREQLRNGGTAYQAASNAKSTITTSMMKEGGKQSVNTTLETLGKAIKDAPKGTETEKAALKVLKSERNLVRAGKWGAVAGAALVTGTVVAGVAGEKIKRRAQRDELASQSWVGYEESRRGMGGGLAR